MKSWTKAGRKGIMKKQSILFVILSILIIILSIIIIFIYFRIESLEYTNSQLAIDNFVIQLIQSILDKNDSFFSKNTKFHLTDLIWTNHVSDNFYIIKENELNEADYLLYFSSSFILRI